MKQTRVRILLEGRLQGANFRLNAQSQAQSLGLVGFVRNLTDGRIEIEAQGDESSVEQMLNWVQEEPHSSQIRSIMFRYDEPVNRYNDFTVR
ncbi:MAG: acylphosphatase [Anaerolineae bacterium]|nr:acylphosphatase [Anaerolineae bacterium]